MERDDDEMSTTLRNAGAERSIEPLAEVGLTEADLPLADAGVARSPHAHAPARAARPWGRWALLGLAIALVIAGLTAAARHRAAATIARPTRDDSAPAEVVALGRLEPRGDVRAVAAPTSAAAPRVREVLVEEGDHVVEGQPLVVLDNQPSLAAAYQAAERAVEIAEVTLEQTRRNVRSSRAESRASVTAARVASEQARRDAERSARLHGSGALPSSQIEAAEASTSRTEAELRRAEAAASRYADSSDVRLAEARLAAARADLERARVELELATVRAPVAGTVLSIEVRAGERASTGTLVRIADLEHMEAELEVFQESVPRIEIGHAVRLASPVFGEEPLTGTLRQIDGEVRHQSLTSTDPAAHADARVVRVHVELDAASATRSARFVGLEVVAHITTDRDPPRGTAGRGEEHQP